MTSLPGGSIPEPAVAAIRTLADLAERWLREQAPGWRSLPSIEIGYPDLTLFPVLVPAAASHCKTGFRRCSQPAVDLL